MGWPDLSGRWTPMCAAGLHHRLIKGVEAMDVYRDIVALERQALVSYRDGHYEEAILAHGQALDIAQNLDRPWLMAVLLNRLGEAFGDFGRIQDAVIAYESGLKALAAEPQSSLEEVVDSIRSMAKGYDPGLAHLEVLDLYSETTASDLGEAESDATLPAKLLINIGNAYLRMPQTAPALNAYERALQRPEISVAPALRAHALTHIGIIRRRHGETDSAEDALREALELLEAHEDPLEKRRALATLAGIYREREEDARAREAYQQALDLYRQTDDPLGEGRVSAGLGHLYLTQERFDDARAAFQRAVELAQQVRDQDTLWHAYWGLGRCQHLAGELEAAAEAFRRSLDGIRARRRELRTDEGKVTFLESVQDIYSHLIAVHLDRAHANASAYADALRIAEEARGQALHDLMGVRRRRFQSRQTGVRSARLRSFDDRVNMASQMAPGVSLPPETFDLAAQMAPGVQIAPPTDLPHLLVDPVWNEGADGMLDWLESAPVTPSGVPRWQDEAEGAPEEDLPIPTLSPLARLVFHVLPERTAVLAVAADGSVQGHVAELGGAALREGVAEVRRALHVDDDPRGVTVTRDVRPRSALSVEDDYQTLLRALYNQLVEPIARALPDDGTPVVIEPHGALWLLPFAALLAPDGTWLADRWPLLYSPSAQVLDEIRQEPDYGGPRDLKPLLVGNPSMPAIPEQDGLTVELGPLPGAERESRMIHKLFAGAEPTLLLGEAADWASVIAQMPKHGILHLATHGIAYAEDPLRSFIALGVPDESALDTLTEHQAQGRAGWPQSKFLLDFADSQGQNGMLTAQQILYLPLPADLVTLSACQTALGQISGDGMIGLSRSFLVAGARAVLVSQWSVSDEATAELMAGFYQGYLELDDKALALQRAMRQLRSRPEFAHPRYWAPFVVVGAEA